MAICFQKKQLDQPQHFKFPPTTACYVHKLQNWILPWIESLISTKWWSLNQLPQKIPFDKTTRNPTSTVRLTIQLWLTPLGVTPGDICKKGTSFLILNIFGWHMGNGFFSEEQNEFTTLLVCYCWWKKSCTSWHGKYPSIYKAILYTDSFVKETPKTSKDPKNCQVTYSSWWLNQPIWKILVKLGIFPKYGWKLKVFWNHHLVLHPFPKSVPFCLCFTVFQQGSLGKSLRSPLA